MNAISYLFAVMMGVTVLLGAAVPSFSESRDKKAIARAKRIDVAILDTKLPNQRFADWFKNTVGAGARIFWEVNDCGEQTGSSADVGRDFPLCAQAEAQLSDGRKVVIRISVGTFIKGLWGTPRLYDCYIDNQGRLVTVKSLSALVDMLRS
jgi:hypothetical protein